LNLVLFPVMETCLLSEAFLTTRYWWALSNCAIPKPISPIEIIPTVAIVKV